MKTASTNLKSRWQSNWPAALRVWSPFVQLHEPIWCQSEAEEKQAGLTGSFAMIRLVDHSVVISLRQVEALGLEAFSKEILAHEIGHHVLCPADLTDNARLLARIRHGLPRVEAYAPMVSNLYSDLLINDRLQRSAELDIAGVYRTMLNESKSKLWLLYMRMYELLWKLPPQSLAIGQVDERMNQDALLGTRLIRSYARNWLGGGGRFACLCFPYVEHDNEESLKAFKDWCDAVGAGTGGYPSGLSEVDDDEAGSVFHPAEDPVLSGISADLGELGGSVRVRSEDSGTKTIKQSRGPFEYREILEASGVHLDPREIAARFYRERAIPHLIPFPFRITKQSTDPLPEGLDTWEESSPLEQIDWWATFMGGATVIPGVTTRERIMGTSPGMEPERIPLDLYLGVDCSGSMRDPALNMSYPILAGAIMVLSALRAGARVKVVLSGEPGKSISTDGFLRDGKECLNLMTNYLGTGYAFGIHRLSETFGPQFSMPRPAHVLVISDSDMFAMLNEKGSGRLGWDVAREAVKHCGGGATFVLQISGGMAALQDSSKYRFNEMQAAGWNVHLVDSLEELLNFARQFSRARYGELLL